MTTKIFGDVERVATGCGGMITRERHVFGPGAFIAPLPTGIQGTSVSAVGTSDDTYTKRTQAAVANGAVSGLRPWSRDPVE